HIHVIINIVGAIHESSEINDSKNNIDLKRAIRQTRAIRELPLQIRRRNMLLSKMVGYIKTRSAKQINVLRNCPGKSVWQRNYYDHIVRNDKSLQKIREYIRNNPLTWKSDIENPDRIDTKGESGVRSKLLTT
ncbi:MAG: transposase, partial [Candidatus Omnitrophica bacterium]|nr:transposase [Candidatus Omnitrophota bacterium]